MARQPKFFTKWSQYLGARTAAMLLTMFEAETNLRTAAAIGRVLHRLDKRHRQRGHDHLAMAFPEWDEAKITQVNEQAFEHFVQLLVEVLHTPRLVTGDNWPNCVELGDFSGALKILNAGKPAILLTGHVGNWELLGTLTTLLGYKLNAVARPIDNPLVNDWLLGIRERRGMRIITKWKATNELVNVLDSGGTLGFIADQNAGDKGMFVPFFGKLASTYKSISLLALHKNVPVCCGFSQRMGHGFNYTFHITDVIQPEDWADQPDPLYYITARYMRSIEKMIRISPSEYLWMHRRWKSRPRHEREGKPMGKSLQAKLENLPWMTDELMKSVNEPMPAALAKK